MIILLIVNLTIFFIVIINKLDLFILNMVKIKHLNIKDL